LNGARTRDKGGIVRDWWGVGENSSPIRYLKASDIHMVRSRGRGDYEKRLDAMIRPRRKSRESQKKKRKDMDMEDGFGGVDHVFSMEDGAA